MWRCHVLFCLPIPSPSLNWWDRSHQHRLGMQTSPWLQCPILILLQWLKRLRLQTWVERSHLGWSQMNIYLVEWTSGRLVWWFWSVLTLLLETNCQNNCLNHICRQCSTVHCGDFPTVSTLNTYPFMVQRILQYSLQSRSQMDATLSSGFM